MRSLGGSGRSRREADVVLEALQTSASQVQDLVLEGPYGSSSLAASLSSMAELIEEHVNAVAANESVGVPSLCWLLPCCSSQS
jgi:hypothetical protein